MTSLRLVPDVFLVLLILLHIGMNYTSNVFLLLELCEKCIAVLSFILSITLNDTVSVRSNLAAKRI